MFVIHQHRTYAHTQCIVDLIWRCSHTHIQIRDASLPFLHLPDWPLYKDILVSIRTRNWNNKIGNEMTHWMLDPNAKVNKLSTKPTQTSFLHRPRTTHKHLKCIRRRTQMWRVWWMWMENVERERERKRRRANEEMLNVLFVLFVFSIGYQHIHCRIYIFIYVHMFVWAIATTIPWMK